MRKQKGKKQITVKRKESERNYMEDLSAIQEAQSTKEANVRKSLVISQSLNDKIEAYIRKRRTGGDIFYSQTQLFQEAVSQLIDANL